MPFSGGKDESKGPIAPISHKTGKSEGAKDVETQQLRNLITEKQKLDRQAAKESGPKLNAEILHKMSRALPRLIQRGLEKIDSSQVYRTFRLAGSDRVVHDNREGRGESANPESKSESRGDAIRRESKMPMEGFLIQKGKMSPETEKPYENFLADPMSKLPQSNPEQQAAISRLKKLLTLF